VPSGVFVHRAMRKSHVGGVRAVDSDLLAAEVPRALHPLYQSTSQTSKGQASAVKVMGRPNSTVRSWSGRRRRFMAAAGATCPLGCARENELRRC